MLGILLGIINTGLKGLKFTANLARQVKNAVKQGVNIKNILSDPRFAIAKLISMLLNFLKWLVLDSVIFILILVICLTIVVTGASILFQAFMHFKGENNVANLSTEMSQWAESLSNKEVQEIMRNGSSIHPKNIPDYIEAERKSLPGTITLDMKVDTYIWERTKGENFSSSTEPYDLNLNKTAYPYRLWWQLIAGMDIVAGNSFEHNDKNKKLIASAESILSPTYEWGYDKYTKDVSNYELVFKKKYKNGKLVYDRLENVKITTRHYPLPYLEAVETAFKNHKFKYKLDTVTEDTGFSDAIVVDVETWTDKELIKVVELPNGIKKPIYDVDRYKVITYKKVRTKVVEDMLANIEQQVDSRRLNLFLKENGINPNDMVLLYEIVSRMPQTEDLTAELSEVLEAPGEGFFNTVYTDLQFNPDVPMIEGEWTRAQLIEVASSLLGLPYFWGGKYYGLGVNPEWGKLRLMTDSRSWAYGKKIPYGMDCSGFVSWVYNQMLIPQGKSFVTGTVNQWVNTYAISEDELRPGDLGFYQRGGGKHVGIYIGEIEGEKAFIHLGGREWADETHPAGKLVISLNNTDKFYKGNAPTRFKYFRRVPVKFKGDSF
ncbi:MAG: C40 family peptidase [Thermosipho sp. (in: Bacteria)]|nr:C40 family peptidase [Thermosipho sp. (in: thermotogales)]